MRVSFGIGILGHVSNREPSFPSGLDSGVPFVFRNYFIRGLYVVSLGLSFESPTVRS